MLIHTSVKIDVHEAYRPPLQEFQQQALHDLRSRGAVLDDWKALWTSESARVPAADFGRLQNPWEEVLARLEHVVESTRIILDNYRSTDRLNYDDDQSVIAIAVGGNTLSRGLTLEGLVVSLFVRSASAYDTLLQMGRWFGYRVGYEDLPRIWMTEPLEAAFRHLAAVEHEMRADIDHYQVQNATPTEVAVRIRTHPLLRVTAKMGAAIPAYVSYAGRRLQTRYFKRQDDDWLSQNLEATRRLVGRLARVGTPRHKGNAAIFDNVDVKEVLQFFEEYQVHEDSEDLNTSLLAKYVQRQTQTSEPALLKWSVAVVGGDSSGSGEDIDLGGGMSFRGVARARLKDARTDRADIKTLMSKEDRVVDMGITQAEARAVPEKKLADLRSQDSDVGDRGLIVLYPIDKDSPPHASNSRTREPLDAGRTVIGIGIVFPGEPGEKNRIFATHVAVDLSSVAEVEEADDLNEILESDPEEDAA